MPSSCRRTAAALLPILALLGCGQQAQQGTTAPATPGTGSTPTGLALSSTSPAPRGFTMPPSPDAAAPRAGSPCQPSQISATAGIAEAALGGRYNRITVRNTSALPCTLDGIPAVMFWSSPTTRVRVTQSAASAASGPGVTLPPSGSARVDLNWRNSQAAAGVPQATAVSVSIGSANGYVPVTLAPSTLPLDIADDTAVRVGLWTTS